MKTIGKALLGASIAVAGLPATAQADDIVRGVIGLGTAIILNEMHRQARPPQRYYQRQTRARQPSAQEIQAREDRREVQRRLNMLGMEAGTPDGIYGRRTRAAISAFQASIGQQPTGRITQEQIAVLYGRTGGTAVAGAQQPTNAFPPFGQNTQFGAQNGQQTGGAFPPVAGGNGQQHTNAFPPFGAPGGQNPQSAPAFPQMGGAQGQQAGTAFPALSTGAGNGQSGQQMPSFVAPGAGAGTSAFPALGVPTGNAGAATMPAISPAMDADGDDAAMPTLSAAAAPQGNPTSLPLLAAPVGQEPSAEVGIAFAPAAETGSQTRTLAGELAKTPFGQGTQPAVMGVTLGQDIAAAESALGDDNFDHCKTSEDYSTIQCHRQSEAMSDKFDLHASPEQGVWSILRTIHFKTPVPAKALNERFSASYPELMAQTSSLKAISSEAVCTGGTMTPGELARAIDGIESGLNRPQEDISETYREFSYRCPIVYSLSFNGEGGMVSRVDITFINATVVDDIAGRRKTQQQEQVDAVSSDLKL